MYYQLVYRSEVADISPRNIREILASSKSNNTVLGITGCLVVRNNFFLQILEGERETVKDLFYTIEDDNRHEEVTILYEGDCQERIFNDWDMAFVDLGRGNDGEKLRVNRAEFDGLIISNISDSFNFSVFWYNVQQLLIRQGFYSPRFDKYENP